MKGYNYRRFFAQQKTGAKERGIPFLLTFEEWYQIWFDSGHLHERGRKKGQYVMARFGDMGPYALGNVKIVTCSENIVEGQLRWALSDLGKQKKSQRMKGNTFSLGLKRSEETKQRLGLASKGRQARLGQKHTEESKRKMSKAQKGKLRSEEHRRNLSIANTGYIKSKETRKKLSDRIVTAETRKKLSESIKAGWARRKQKLLTEKILAIV